MDWEFPCCHWPACSRHKDVTWVRQGSFLTRKKIKNGQSWSAIATRSNGFSLHTSKSPTQDSQLLRQGNRAHDNLSQLVTLDSVAMHYFCLLFLPSTIKICRECCQYIYIFDERVRNWKLEWWLHVSMRESAWDLLLSGRHIYHIWRNIAIKKIYIWRNMGNRGGWLYRNKKLAKKKKP